MSNVMPSQVIQTIDELFPHAKSGGNGPIDPDSHGTQLRGILSLIKAIPEDLLALSPSDYADFALAISTVETHLERWVVRGNVVGFSKHKGPGRSCGAPACAGEVPRRASSRINNRAFDYQGRRPSRKHPTRHWSNN